MNDPKVSVKYVGTDLLGDHYTVTINGRKYPRERGINYIGKESQVREWAIAEYEGKYVTNNGKIFQSQKDYDKWLEELFDGEV